MSSQMTIRLADVEAYAPPEEVVAVAVVDNTLHLTIEKSKEAYKDASYERIAGIAVHVEDFLNAVHTAWQDDKNSVARKAYQK